MKVGRPFMMIMREKEKSMRGVKIYGLYLERLKYQITNARRKRGSEGSACPARVPLECYNTGKLEDILNILELYDVKDKTVSEVNEKLEDLAYTVSELVRETVLFDYTVKDI